MSQHDGEDLLLERLREATSSEAGLRQLRHRYDLLRRDYEVLLDRVAELEERLAIAGTSQEAAPGPQPAPAAAPPPPVIAEPAMKHQLLAPLLQLRDEYAEVLESIQAIVGGLNAVVQGAMKGQRGSNASTRPGASTAVRDVEVEVRSTSFGNLLDFQERLAAMPGVARVSIHGIDSEQATFVIELE